MAGNLDFRLNLLANTTGLQQGMDGAKFAVNALVAAMAAVGVGLSVQGLVEAADKYSNLSARINIATSDGGNFQQAMAGVHQVALMTNSSLDATAGLFTKVNDVGKQMGMTQQQSLDLVKTINMAIQTGGGSAQAAEAAITQFTQALQSGVLRGDEFNSIMEQAPGISGALAKSLGVTTGELRKMAENGELSAQKVIKALQSQSAAIEADYAKFPTTIGNALQRITTSWEILIGTMDQSNGASATVAQWLVTLADNMSVVETILEDIGEGFIWAGDQLKKIDPATIEALKAALSATYDTIKELGSTVGIAFEAVFDILNTALSKIFNFNSGLETASDQTSGFTKLLQALNVVIGFISDGFSAIGIGVNLLTGAIYDVAAAFVYWKSKLLFGEAKDQALKEYEELSRKAQDYYKKGSDGAVEFKSSGVEAIKEISKTQKEKDAESVESSKQKLNKLLADQQSEVDGKKASEADKVKAVKDYAAEAIEANGGVLDSAVQLDLQSKGYMVTLDSAGKVVVTSMAEAKIATEEAAKATELAKEKAKQAETDYQEFMRTSAIERILLQKQIEQAKITGDLTALNSAKTSLAAIDTRESELNEIRKQRNAEAVSGAVGVSKAAESAAKGAAEALGINLDVSLNRVSKSFKEAGGQVVTLSSDVKGLGVSGKEASNLIYEGWVKWLEKAKSPAEIDMAKAKLQEFEKQGVFSAKQVQMGMEHLDQVNGKLPQNISEVEKAYKLLGITSRKEAGEAADAQMKAFNVLKQSGTASVEELRQALINMADKIYASGDAAKIAAYEAKLAYHGLSKEVSETGQVSVKANNAVEESLHRVRNATGNAGDGFDDLGRRGVRAGNDTTEAWEEARKATEAAMASQGKMKASKTGTTAKHGLSVEEIEQRLKDIGYEGDTKQKAKELFQDAEPVAGGYYKSASNEWVKRKYGTTAYDNQKALGNAMYVMEQIERLEQYVGKNGRSTGFSSLNDYAPSIPSVPSTKDYGKGGDSVNYNIQFGGQTLSLTGDASQKDVMTSLVNQLKGIAKST